MYGISNSGYPGACANTLIIPVIEDTDPSMLITLPFRGDLQIGTTFPFSIEEAIQAADRHIYIEGRPPNPLAFIEDWINILRWEVNNLWKVDVANSQYERNLNMALTHEHYKRSGELLAEGIAVLFLEKRLRVSRQRFFFYRGAGARPDYVVSLKARHRRALLLQHNKIGIEVRSRTAACRNIPAPDRKDIRAKKTIAGLGGVLAVYCYYGTGRHRDGISRTRIQLADPPSDRNINVHDYDEAATVIHHYLSITSQLGLWDHRDHLIRAAKEAHARKIYRTPLRVHDSQRVERCVSHKWMQQSYQGREFNELLYLAGENIIDLETKQVIQREIRHRLDAGDYGTLTFRGLNDVALQHIENCRWEELLDFHDSAAKSFEVDRWVRNDGLYRFQTPIRPDSEESQDLMSQLNGFLQGN